ncbi:MAG: hypothetical protein IPJ58_15820 [Ardenticatenia bacterium]|nr:hypothetical protein [Ardenticatenia bacterium]
MSKLPVADFRRLARRLLLGGSICIAAWSAGRRPAPITLAEPIAPRQGTAIPTATDGPGSLPDLVITGWTFSHDFITCPRFIRWDYIHVRIQNLGDAPAGRFVVLSRNHRWDVDELGPRSELVLPSFEGDLQLPAKIDALDEVLEFDEDNNLMRVAPSYTATPNLGPERLFTQPAICTETPTPTVAPTRRLLPVLLPRLGSGRAR